MFLICIFSESDLLRGFKQCLAKHSTLQNANSCQGKKIPKCYMCMSPLLVFEARAEHDPVPGPFTNPLRGPEEPANLCPCGCSHPRYPCECHLMGWPPLPLRLPLEVDSSSRVSLHPFAGWSRTVDTRQVQRESGTRDKQRKDRPCMVVRGREQVRAC